jgi:hypothetical protein
MNTDNISAAEKGQSGSGSRYYDGQQQRPRSSSKADAAAAVSVAAAASTSAVSSPGNSAKDAGSSSNNSNNTSSSSVASTRIKFIVLILLCCQNAGHALLTRYSQGVLKESYSSGEVVLVCELLKLVVSGYLTLHDTAETGKHQ